LKIRQPAPGEKRGHTQFRPSRQIDFLLSSTTSPFPFSLLSRSPTMDYSSRTPSDGDLEKQANLSGKTNNSLTNVSVRDPAEQSSASSIGSKFDRSFCQPIRRLEEKCGMESRGIERVKEEDCTEGSAWGRSVQFSKRGQDRER
jgi:hypothetical protein